MLFLLMGRIGTAENAAEALLQGIGFDQLEECAEGSGLDVRALAREVLSGDFDADLSTLRNWTASLIERVKAELTRLLLRLCMPVLTAMALRALLGQDAWSGAGLLCRLCCGRILLAEYALAREAASALLGTMVGVLNAATPVLAAALAASGAEGAASTLSPMTALIAGAAENLLGNAGLALCDVAAVVAVSGCLSERFPLDKLFRLLKEIIIWMVGALMAAFTALMSIEGLIGAARDTAGARTARMALENLVPFIGGELSSTADALAGSGRLLGCAVGVSGMAALLAACMVPMLKLAAGFLSMKLASAIIEPTGEKGMTDLTDRFADVTQMLLVLCIGCGALGLLLIGGGMSVAENWTRWGGSYG